MCQGCSMDLGHSFLVPIMCLSCGLFFLNTRLCLPKGRYPNTIEIEVKDTRTSERLRDTWTSLLFWSYMGNEKREETLPQSYESPCWIFKWSHRTNDLFKLEKCKIQFYCAYGNQRTEKIRGGWFHNRTCIRPCDELKNLTQFSHALWEDFI